MLTGLFSQFACPKQVAAAAAAATVCRICQFYSEQRECGSILPFLPIFSKLYNLEIQDIVHVSCRLDASQMHPVLPPTKNGVGVFSQLKADETT